MPSLSETAAQELRKKYPRLGFCQKYPRLGLLKVPSAWLLASARIGFYAGSKSTLGLAREEYPRLARPSGSKSTLGLARRLVKSTLGLARPSSQVVARAQKMRRLARQ
jgi:hypothetical protein